MIDILEKYSRPGSSDTYLLTEQEYEDMVVEMAKKDTGVDLTDRVWVSFDMESLAVGTMILSEEMEEHELEQLGGYDFQQHYTTTEYVLYRIFGEMGYDIVPESHGMELNYRIGRLY